MASPADKASRDNDKSAQDATNKGSAEPGTPDDAKRKAAGKSSETSNDTAAPTGARSPSASSDSNMGSSASTGAAFVQQLRNRQRELQGVLDGRAAQSAEPREVAIAFARAWLPFDRVEAGVMQRALNASSESAEALEEAEVRTDLLNILLANLLGGPDPEKALLDGLAEQFAGLAKVAEQCEGALLQALDSMPQSSRLPLSQLEARYESAKRRFERLDNDAIGEAMEMLAPRRLSVPAQRQQRRSEYDVPRYSSQMRDRDDQGRFLPEDERGYGRGGHRGSMPERDESGRFMSDDERRSRSGYDDDNGSRRSMNRRRDDDDDRRYGSRDRGHSGWFGDSEGHSEASRRGWERSDHGESGWYGDRDGHAEAARRGWERPDHGESGWFGDREGHSEASRRGWEHSEHGPSGWYGDREGHSEASRRGWERSDHGQSGWYGDREGHSEASRRGWDEGHGSQRRDDDDRRSSRYDDERRSYAGGRGERYEDERSFRGHRGWSGDPEGHSEASRRGKERRR
jgi:hypothetical protein